MGITLAAIYALAAALLNRWRGGSWPYLPTEVHGGPNDHKRTQVRRIVFAVGLGLLAWNPWVGAIAFLSCLTGWGFPVSAAIGVRKPTDWEPEFFVLDWISKRVLPTYSAKAYGIIWLTIHGALFGALASVAMFSLWPMLWAGMGACYAATKDWEHGEYAHGALIGLGIYLAVLS
jgi:hypothetical protein